MTVDGVKQLNAEFAKIKILFDHQNLGGLVCKQGFYKDCAVLKLQKTSWTNDPIAQLQNQSGIFFSIWVDSKLLREYRANYNIHALKLRDLEGYVIASREFANDFREGFASMRNDWPNVGFDYGPQTLMQGWVEIIPNTMAKDLSALMERFKNVSPLIDRLLDSRRR